MDSSFDVHEVIEFSEIRFKDENEILSGDIRRNEECSRC